MRERVRTKKDCACCGEPFSITGHYAVYCETCRKMPQSERKRMKDARDRALGRAMTAATRKPRRCSDFDTTGKSLRRIDAECRLFGMSYGKHTAACRAGTIEAELKAKGFKNPQKMLRELEFDK